MLIRKLLILVFAIAFTPVSLGQAQSGKAAADPEPIRQAELSRAVDVLIRALNDSDSKVRADAALSLGQIRGKLDGATLEIAQLLTDDDPQVRVAAADSLLRSEDPGLLPYYLRAIDDSDARVQFRAAIGLHRLASKHHHPIGSGDARGKHVAPDWYQGAIDRAKTPAIREQESRLSGKDQSGKDQESRLSD